MRTIFLSLSLLLFGALSLNANNLRIVGMEAENTANGFSVRFTIAWDNAWRNAKNHDAAWVFLKFKPRDPQYMARHVLAKTSGHTMLGKLPANLPDPVVEVSDDQVGVFIYPAANWRGNVEWTLRLAFDKTSIGRLDPWQGEWALHALEMVYVAAGGFTLGDPDTAALKAASFFRSGEGGHSDGLFEIKSENQVIEVGEQPGQLNYRAAEPEYQGDGKGPVPAEFPKGVQAFYVQKYEIAQGEYASFLNDLSVQASYFRANFGGKNYYRERGSIALEGDKYIAKSPRRPLNFVGWDDGCAFADWAGLRPMTELEFEKACRGGGAPIPHEYPWGSADKNRLARYVDLDDELKNAPGLDESQLTDANRDVFGASYWWVMDLAGSLWERVVSVGHPAGRAFKGSHGDGKPGYYGFATNEDWPHGDDERNGGYGYRGGGYYEHGKPAGDFNPHSPVGWRNFAAWAGGPRSIAYGFRCVRTAR
jgi:formylglycine-generating enzyme required for sulfatase activity